MSTIFEKENNPEVKKEKGEMEIEEEKQKKDEGPLF